ASPGRDRRVARMGLEPAGGRGAPDRVPHGGCLIGRTQAGPAPAEYLDGRPDPAATTLMLSVPVGSYTLEVPGDMAWCFEGGSYYERNVSTWFERIAGALDGGAV